MRLLYTVIALTIALQSTQARCKRPRQNHVMGALQNILSPANAERTMALLQLATQRTIGNTVGPYNPTEYPVKYPPLEPCYSPINLPNSVMIPNQPPPIPLPTPCQTPGPFQVQIPNPVSYQVPMQLPCPPIQVPTPPIQLPSPPILAPNPPIQVPSPPIQLPSPPIQLPNPPIHVPNPPIQVPFPPIQASAPEILLPNPIPMPIPYQVPPTAPIPMPEVVERPCFNREIIFPSADLPVYEYNPVPESLAPVALTSAQDIYTYPLPTPAALFTLPAASPCSSCSRESPRSHYLRKIPIPPPTL